MVGSIITIEDVNTAIFNNQDFYWHEIDTSLISDSDDGDYSDVKYDFCKISRTKRTANNDYLFTVKVFASNWTGGWRCHDNISKEYDYSNILEFASNTPVMECGLYMGNQIVNSNRGMSFVLEKNKVSLNLKELKSEHSFKYKYYFEDSWIGNSNPILLHIGYNQIKDEQNVNSIGYLLVNLVKTDFKFECNQNLLVGKVNKVCLGVDADYLPNGDMVGDNDLNIHVVYKNNKLPVTFDESLNDYVFELDLSDKVNTGNVKFDVVIKDSKVVNSGVFDVVLSAGFEQVSNFSDLLVACDVGGSDIVELVNGVTATSNIPVKHSIKIISDNKVINLNNHSFVLNEGVNLIGEKIWFNNGNTAIIQEENTKLELNQCTFINCTSTNYNGLGSCIFCDVDLDNLETTTDFETTLTECEFTNNHSTILHGGELTVNNCKFRNTEYEVIDNNNVAFIYQTDGNAIITNSIFDIDYTFNSLCSNEENIGFAQAIIMCGETATINGANHTELQDNETLPLFDNNLNNQAHLFCKYYYPQISSCVFSSPEISYEAKSCCHAVSGVDWVFKNNVQVTRASWGTENNLRLIEW